MYVISHASTVRSGVVVAKDVELRSLADYYLLDVREEVVGMYCGLIAQEMAAMGSARVEVPERDNPPVLVHLRQ